MVALLYDIHGNLVALEEVLKDAEAAGAEAYLLGGDFGSWSPWPRETIERLRGLPNTTWIRGNGERWLREPPLDRPEVMAGVRRQRTPASARTKVGSIPSREPGNWTARLRARLAVVGCRELPAEPGADDERMLNGVRDRTVVFGHSHRSSAAGSERNHAPRSGQRRDATRRRRAGRLRAAGSSDGESGDFSAASTTTSSGPGRLGAGSRHFRHLRGGAGPPRLRLVLQLLAAPLTAQSYVVPFSSSGRWSTSRPGRIGVWIDVILSVTELRP